MHGVRYELKEFLGMGHSFQQAQCEQIVQAIFDVEIMWKDVDSFAFHQMSNKHKK